MTLETALTSAVPGLVAAVVFLFGLVLHFARKCDRERSSLLARVIALETTLKIGGCGKRDCEHRIPLGEDNRAGE